MKWFVCGLFKSTVTVTRSVTAIDGGHLVKLTGSDNVVFLATCRDYNLTNGLTWTDRWTPGIKQAAYVKNCIIRIETSSKEDINSAFHQEDVETFTLGSSLNPFHRLVCGNH